MKTLKFSVILLALFLSETFAQGTTLNAVTNDPKSGVYLTAFNYKHNQLHLIGDQQANSKFRLNDFFGGKTLTITHQGKTYQF
jgi:hypothetical protein